MLPAMIVHGGAGEWKLKDIDAAVAACVEAAEVGQRLLRNGGLAMDAVEAAVCVLEDCPLMDAGRGCYPNREGNVEMDALIMDGRSLDLGAVAAVQCVRHPVSLARRVLADTPHTLLAGDGAGAFADQIGFPRCELSDLLVENASYEPVTSDTVAAVAIDQAGNLAVAVSTGGTRNKMPGRVGDSPLVGCGGYADNRTAAAAATGHGEALMKVVITKTVCDFAGLGMAAQAACEAAIKLLSDRVNGKGGLIAIDARGRIGFAYNTSAMPYAYVVGAEATLHGH